MHDEAVLVLDEDKMPASCAKNVLMKFRACPFALARHQSTLDVEIMQ